jgi:ribosomal protein S18 acetylase RimI-like enzyme
MIINDVEILTATIADAPRILEIQKKAFQVEALLYGRDDLPPLMQSLDSFMQEFNKYDYLKATFQGQVIGSVRASVTGNTCFIGRLIVDPEYQKKGVGTELMDYLENKYNAIPRFELFTGKKSGENIRLYSKRGYRIFDESCESDNIELVKMEKVRG